MVNKMVLDIEKILKLSQEELLSFAYVELLKRNYYNRDIVYTEDYVYAKGTIPILLVAHLDIVHKSIPETIVYDKQKKILWSPTGIGGDDRCGVFGILKICEKFKPYVLFTTDEEKGGLGVRKFVKDFNELPVNFIIEIDRRGNRQAVFYDCGNKEFQNYILSFGFEKQVGSYSDVRTLSTSYDIAGCNLSAGYYNEHTNTEHIYLDHLYNTINGIKDILKDTKNHKFYDCQEIKYTPTKYSYSSYYDKYDRYYDSHDDYFDPDWWKKDKKKVVEVEEKKEEETKEKIIEEEKEETLEEIQEEINKIAEGKKFSELDFSQMSDEDFDIVLQKEEDYYALTNKQWVKKYGFQKPDDISLIY